MILNTPEVKNKLMQQGYWRSVPGWSGSRMIEDFIEQVDRVESNSYFIEIGAWKGQTATLMASLIHYSGKHIYFDVIDTWEGSDELVHEEDEDIQQGTLYEAFLKNIEPLSNYIHPVKLDSVEASKNYNDETIDFIFLDASHKTEDVINDIEAWKPKLKKGGVLIGDDYDWDSVKEAVLNSSVKENFVEITNVTGSFWKYVKS